MIHYIMPYNLEVLYESTSLNMEAMLMTFVSSSILNCTHCWSTVSRLYHCFHVDCYTILLILMAGEQG